MVNVFYNHGTGIIVSKIHDVAKRANVSIATVSRVLNSSDHKVSAKTAEKVRQAV